MYIYQKNVAKNGEPLDFDWVILCGSNYNGEEKYSPYGETYFKVQPVLKYRWEETKVYTDIFPLDKIGENTVKATYCSFECGGKLVVVVREVCGEKWSEYINWDIQTPIYEDVLKFNWDTNELAPSNHPDSPQKF